MQVSIYPNPSSGKLFLCGTEAGTRVSVYNHGGEKVYTASPASTYSVIDLGAQPEGVYFMILSPPGKIGQKKKIELVK